MKVECVVISYPYSVNSHSSESALFKFKKEAGEKLMKNWSNCMEYCYHIAI